MDTQRWERAGNIFEKLLDAPDEQRTALLETLCGDDAEMRDIVASMLHSESSALAFERAYPLQRVNTGETTSEVDAPPADSRVGPWRLVRELGRGGMGVVWLAERADGQFEQRAALKLIKRGMDSDAVLKRFLRERQILARLDHPHIAHLLDGGLTADGRPYFAMEYVEGVPLLRYCHEHAATLERRLRLFLDTCEALQYAHANHVVHRDLKPSNVMVTPGGTVKLLDFGIAKLLDSGDGTVETITHRERPMTPAYAAPEQMSGGMITEATDVFALGCVLYELLTGQRARNADRAVDVHQMLHLAETTDPVAPSRLKLITAPVPLRSLRGDLDTIVLKALKREPARRYASVVALADDIKSHLGGKPIAARRDHVLYRSWKFVRRHRVGIAATLAIGLIGALALYQARYRGTTALFPQGTAIAIVDFNNLARAQESTWLAPALAEMLATQLSLGGKLRPLPDELVRAARADLPTPLTGGYALASLATLRKRLGADYVLSGSYFLSGGGADAALRLDLTVQDARSALPVASVAENGVLSDLPALVDKAGMSLRQAMGYAPPSADQQQELGNAEPPSVEVARRIGLAMEALRKYDPARAKDELLQAEVVAPAYAPTYVYLAQAWKNLGYDARARAAAKQAELHAEGLPLPQKLQITRQVALQQSHWAEVLKADDELLRLDPKNPELALALVDDRLNAGKPDEAESALTNLRMLAPGDPRVELRAASIGQIRGDPKAQAQHAQLALQVAQQRDAPALAAQAKRTLGIALDQLGDHERAEALFREAIGDFQRSGNPKGEAGARTSLAILMAGRNQPQRAREEYERALALFQRIGDQNGMSAIYSNMTILLWDHGDRDAAEAAARRVFDIRRETDDAAGQAWALLVLAQIQLDDNASDATMDTYRQAIAIDEQAGERAHRLLALQKYSEALQLRGDLEGAREACGQAQTGASNQTNANTVTQIALTCASIALDRGELQAFAAGLGTAVESAKRDGDSETLAYTDLLSARVDVANLDFTSALPRLQRAIKTFQEGEVIAAEANAQSLAALCHAALGQTEDRERAEARARELRNAITIHGAATVIDRQLAQLLGARGRRKEAVASLLELANDAEQRQWLAYALEARLAAVQWLEKEHDPSAAVQRKQLADVASRHGFGWLLARLGIVSGAGSPQPQSVQ